MSASRQTVASAIQPTAVSGSLMTLRDLLSAPFRLYEVPKKEAETWGAEKKTTRPQCRQIRKDADYKHHRARYQGNPEKSALLFVLLLRTFCTHCFSRSQVRRND